MPQAYHDNFVLLSEQGLNSASGNITGGWFVLPNTKELRITTIVANSDVTAGSVSVTIQTSPDGGLTAFTLATTIALNVNSTTVSTPAANSYRHIRATMSEALVTGQMDLDVRAHFLPESLI